MSGSFYRPRATEQTFTDHASHQVAILEGRRAIDKSTSARHLVDTGIYVSYQTLADPTERANAAADPTRWLASLDFPAIIDEAQLVPDLSLAVKELVDSRPPGHHVLLTGSASVGRGQLEGSDPLVGRATRTRLHPFSALETSHPAETDAPCLVDLLFDAQLDLDTPGPVSTQELVRLLRTGGVPSYCLSTVPLTTSALEVRVHSDMLALLSDRVLPEEKLDVGIAGTVLDSILRIPGGQLNKTGLAAELGIDQRTVSRYLGILDRRFLLTFLPNLRTGLTRTSKTMPKVHSSDSSATCEAISRAGHDIASSPEALGQVLESWVVQQLTAARGWAHLKTRIFYWRDNKTQREVDVVLFDGAGRRVGIEVKLATSVSPSDLKGLKALQEHGGLHRGFIVHTGTRFEQIADKIWALPIAAFIQPSAWGAALASPSSPTPTRKVIALPPEKNVITTDEHPASMSNPSVFLSYVHDDDDYFDGLLIAFTKKVIQACRSELGTPVELITDNISLAWGENWREKLQKEVGRTTFLMAMVTPSYIRSQACRDEFLQFRTKTAKAGYQGLLTLLVKNPRWEAPDVRDDPICRSIRETIDEHQWLSLDHPLENLEPETRDFRNAARSLGKELARRIEALEAQETPTLSAAPSENPSDSPENEGIIELLETLLESDAPAFSQRSEDFNKVFAAFGEAFNRELSKLPSGSIPSSAALVLAANKISPTRIDLDKATDALATAWTALDDTLTRLLRLVGESGLAEHGKELKEMFSGLSRSMNNMDFGGMNQQVQMLSAMSRTMRPAASTLSRVFSTTQAIARSAEIWEENL